MKRPMLYKGKYLMNEYLKQTNSIAISGINEYPDRLYITNGFQSGIAYKWRTDNNNITVLVKDYSGDICELEIRPINILNKDVCIASLGQSPYVMLKN